MTKPNSSKLARPKADYTVAAIRMTWDRKSTRKEYSRLRSIWKKRYERLMKSEYKNSSLVQDRPITRYPKLSEIGTDREVQYLLSELGAIIGGEYTSVEGLKKLDKERIEKLNDKWPGLNLKTRDDLKTFGDFMEKVRGYTADRIYDSDFAVDIFDQTENLSNEKMLELYKEFLKTGSRKIGKLQANINRRNKQKRAQRKTRRKKRR